MQYFEPNFVDEALVLLDRYGSGARLLAGGTRVGFTVRAHPESTAALINLKRIRELATIEERDGALRIGALATAHEIASHPLIVRHAPMLAQAADSMGAVQLRSVATLGGNVCSGDPASDLSTVLLAHDASCDVARPDARAQSMPIEELLAEAAAGGAALPLLVSVSLPIAAHRSAYEKMTTRAGFEMALVAVAVRAPFSDGALSDIRIALAGAAPSVIRAPAAERALVRSTPTAQRAREAAQLAADQDARPASDARASEPYRRHLVAVLTERAVLRVLASDEKAAS